jgi:hypothetical protein
MESTNHTKPSSCSISIETFADLENTFDRNTAGDMATWGTVLGAHRVEDEGPQ